MVKTAIKTHHQINYQSSTTKQNKVNPKFNQKHPFGLWNLGSLKSQIHQITFLGIEYSFIITVITTRQQSIYIIKQNTQQSRAPSIQSKPKNNQNRNQDTSSGKLTKQHHIIEQNQSKIQLEAYSIILCLDWGILDPQNLRFTESHSQE